MKKSNNVSFYKCGCGSENFIKVFNVWNVKIKVEITNEDDTEYWDEIEGEKEKDHLCGYICAECRKNADELNEAL